MSSNCSINCCSSPEVTSSNVSVSNMNGAVSNDTSGGRVRTTVPDTKKDNKYWERRRRNNEAARRSREKRRQNDMVMDKRILELSQRNKQLENELFQLKMNFGLVNNSQPKLEIDDFTSSLISPTTVHEASHNANTNSTDHINGMVFPVFTAFPSSTDVPEIVDKANSEGMNKSIVTSILNDNPKTCITTNKYQSNLITLGNIPFLSTLISTPNFSDDITSKATLLLPSLVSKTPTKSIESGPSSGGLNTSTVLTVEGLTFNRTPEVCSDSKKRSVSVDASQISSTGNHLKLDFHDILDLSFKQENNDCFFINTEGSPKAFGRTIGSNEVLDGENKDAITRSSPDNHLIDGSLTNSFLSGILSTNSKNRLAVCMKRKSLINANRTNHFNNNKTRRCNSFSDNSADSNPNKCHYSAIRHHLDLKTRLHIRREVSTIVVNENRKLREDIHCLSTEIQLLKSAILECAKLSVTKSIANHNFPIIQSQQHQYQNQQHQYQHQNQQQQQNQMNPQQPVANSPERSDSIFIQCSSIK